MSMQMAKKNSELIMINKINLKQKFMKHLIVVRHGDYATGGILSEQGKKQINSIALQLISLQQNQNSVILTSPAPRAQESADIMQQKLGIAELVKVPFFWSDTTAPAPTYYKDRDPYKVMDIINQYSDKDIVIIVSHLELVNQFPRFFAETKLGKYWRLPELQKGQAIHFDIQQKSFKILKDIKESLLNSKLNLLHNLLVITDPRPVLSDELSDYSDDYQEFLEETAFCADSFEKKYTDALAKFRDILLANI